MSTADAPSAGLFQDTSTECAICLEPLDDNNNNAATPRRKVLTLSCGHKWHADCLREQLQTAQPKPSEQRLLFRGCQCAKCGQICHHPALDDLTRTTDRLRDQVYALVAEQLEQDGDPQWMEQQAATDHTAKQVLLEEGLRKYAFYLCGHCEKPYFGGTIDCADDIHNNNNNNNHANAPNYRRTAQERLCVACTPPSQVTCRNPLEHRRHLIWKCRYCCQPAQFLCYGNVHFCQDCHQRHSVSPQLEAIPCPGRTCPYPKPPKQAPHDDDNSDCEECHSNGPTFASEQVYGCAVCASAGTDEPEAGSANLLVNPSGQDGTTRGWRHLSRGVRWVTERSEIPVRVNCPTNFVSSYQNCVMEQTLDLRAVLQDDVWSNHRDIPFEVSARYMGRTDCPSVFCLQAYLLQQPQSGVCQRQSTPALPAPPDGWEAARLVLTWNNNHHRYLKVVVMGKDTRFWRGTYGSKVTDVRVRILGSPDQLARWMRRNEDDDRFVDRNAANDNRPQPAGGQQGNEAYRRPGIYPLLRWLSLLGGVKVVEY